MIRFTIEKMGIVAPEKMECPLCHMKACQLTYIDIDEETGQLIKSVLTCECGGVMTMKNLPEDEQCTDLN